MYVHTYMRMYIYIYIYIYICTHVEHMWRERNLGIYISFADIHSIPSMLNIIWGQEFAAGQTCHRAQ